MDDVRESGGMPTQTLLYRPCGNLRSGREPKFAKDMLDMLGNCSLAQHQFLSNQPVGSTVSDQDGDCPLAFGQAIVGMFRAS